MKWKRKSYKILIYVENAVKKLLTQTSITGWHSLFTCDMCAEFNTQLRKVICLRMQGDSIFKNTHNLQQRMKHQNKQIPRNFVKEMLRRKKRMNQRNVFFFSEWNQLIAIVNVKEWLVFCLYQFHSQIILDAEYFIGCVSLVKSIGNVYLIAIFMFLFSFCFLVFD